METNSNKKNILHITSKVTVGNSAGGTRSHDKLANLDYASSGHIGFASSEDLTNLAAQTLNDAKQYVDESIEKIAPQDCGALINEHNNNTEAHADIRTQIRLIQMVLTSNDTDFDTLQELVNALKNNTSSIGDIFTLLSKKVDKGFYKSGDGVAIAEDGTISVTFENAEGGSF